MRNSIPPYLISIGVGVAWIVIGMNSTIAPLCIGIGVAAIAVGALSVVNELRHRRGWR